MTIPDEEIKEFLDRLERTVAEWRWLPIDDETRHWLDESLNYLPATAEGLRALAVERYERARGAGVPEKWLYVIERENEMLTMSANALDMLALSTD